VIAVNNINAAWLVICRSYFVSSSAGVCLTDDWHYWLRSIV